MEFQGETFGALLRNDPPGYPKGTLLVQGSIGRQYLSRDCVIQWVAADPGECRLSRYGSQQAFPSPESAITGKNCGVQECMGGKFEFVLKRPNAYYANGGTILLPPHIRVIVWDKDIVLESKPIVLDTILPYKGLTYAPQRTGPEFYSGNQRLPPRSQQSIFIQSIHPGLVNTKNYAVDFWKNTPRPG
jgi:hypothetical protein